jgi:hypothetical protein
LFLTGFEQISVNILAQRKNDLFLSTGFEQISIHILAQRNKDLFQTGFEQISINILELTSGYSKSKGANFVDLKIKCKFMY